MRQYRGLTKDGKWVYGWYAEKQDSHYNSYSVIINDEIEDEIIPETVGQSTGEKDKNKKEIYKGDCFRTSDKHGYSSNCIAEVIFEDGAFVVQLYRDDEMEMAPELILDFKRSFQDSFEIIGNIHTTPKLLEKL